jgi:hypothetical protein
VRLAGLSEAAGTELLAGALQVPLRHFRGRRVRPGPGSPGQVTDGVRRFLQEIDEQTWRSLNG